MTTDDNSLDPLWLDYLPYFLQTKLKERKNLQKIVANMGWLLFDKILRMGVGLVVGVWIARYLGPAQFGIINYAGAFVGMFAGLTSLGLDGIVVRELVRRPDDKNIILGTSFLLKLVASVFSSLIAIVSIYLTKNNILIIVAVSILSGTMIVQAFDVIRFWFESQVKSKHVVIAQNTAFLLTAVFKIVLLLQKASLVWFIWIVLFESVLGAFGFLYFYRRDGGMVTHWSFSRREGVSLLRDSWPLIFSVLAIFVYMRISQIMLGGMSGEQAVGIYAAATRVSEIWYFIPTIVLTSIYPGFVKLYSINMAAYEHKLLRVMSLFFWLSVIGAVLVQIFSRDMIALLYGAEYAQSSQVLSIHIFSGIIVNISIIFSHRYLLKGQQKISLFGTIVGALFNILLNYILIPKYGVLGSAIATLISQFVPTIFVALFFDPSVGRIFLKTPLAIFTS